MSFSGSLIVISTLNLGLHNRGLWCELVSQYSEEDIDRETVL